MQDLLLRVLRHEEGLRLDPYQDSRGWWTIGYGHLIDRRRGGSLPKWIAPSFPISQDEADELLAYDVREAQIALGNRLPFFPKLDGVRQVVLAAMAFQLGLGGVLAFRLMLAAMERADWRAARAEMLNSKWARQTSARAQRMANALATGDANFFGLPIAPPGV